MSVFVEAASSLSVRWCEAVRDFTHEGELKPGQVGAARFLLGWSQLDLARAAGLARTTVVSFENESRAMLPSVRDALRNTLEDAGVEFVYANDGSYGVVLVKARRQKRLGSLSAKNDGAERRR